MALSETTPEQSLEPRIGRSVSLDHAAQLLNVVERFTTESVKDGCGRSGRLADRNGCCSTPFTRTSTRNRWAVGRPSDVQQSCSVGLPVFNPPSGLRRECVFKIVVAVFCAGATMPALAQHRARLSADLAGRMVVGSQGMDVIVQGDQPAVDALAKSVNVAVKRVLKRRRRPAAQRRSARGAQADPCGRSPVGRRAHSLGGRRHRLEHRRRSGVGRRERAAEAVRRVWASR